MSLQTIRERASQIIVDVDELLEPPPPPPPGIVVNAGDNLRSVIEQAPAGATIQVANDWEGDGFEEFRITKPLRIQAQTIPAPGRAAREWQLPTLRNASISPAAPDVQLAGLKLYGDGRTLVFADERAPRMLLDQVVLLGRGDQPQHKGVIANSVDAVVVRAYIGDIWKDIDTQAVGCWAHTKNLQVLDSFLEASGENFMAGGADAPSESAMPDGILIDGCDLSKPADRWRNRGDIGVKNLFELKNCRNVTLRRSRLRNNWADAQSGNAIVLTVRNQSGTNPWATIENALLEDLEVESVGALLSVLGRDYIHPSQVARNLVCRRWTVRDLSWEYTEPGRAASGRPFSVSAGPIALVLEDINVEGRYDRNAATIGFDNHAYPCVGLQMRRCRLPEGSYGITGTVPGVIVGEGQLAGNAPGYVWEDMTIVRPPNPVRTPVYPAGTTRIPFPG